MIKLWIFTLIFYQSVFAGLTLWTPTGYQHTFLLPESVTPAQFLQSAQKHPKSSKYLMDLSYQKQDRVQVVSQLPGSQLDRVLLIANARNDHDQKQLRIKNFSSHLHNSFVLPIGAAFFLDSVEREKFYSEISKNFGLLIPMGGDDVTPELYNEKNTWSVGFDSFRDQLEISLLQYFYKHSNGKIMGICRGMQITCVALGGKLHQDLIQELGIQENHKDGAAHDIFLTGPRNHPGTKFLSRFSDWKGDSWHHQALNKKSLKDTPLSVVAESREGVVEAAASHDNRILILQSHPEKSDPSTGQAQAFFQRLKEWVRDPVTRGCRQVLKTSH